jgi:hypothetical protein
MKTLLALLGVVGVLALVVGSSYISAYNYGNRAEQGVVAAWENNENILSQYGQKLQEAASVTTILKQDVQDILSGAIEARYGANGSQATMQWIQEQNPTVTPEVYVKVQQIAEAGRNEFQNAQTRLIDAKRGYRTELGNFWSGLWLRVAGYPKINIGFPIGAQDDYEAITTTRASNAFETGREEGPIPLR